MTPRTKVAEVIRDLTPEDHEAISTLAKLSFPVNQSGFVTPGRMGGKVIAINEKLVAASLLRIIVLPSGRKIGFIAWLMTHPEYRGRGLAKKLVASSTVHLQSKRCDDIVTDVEGYNTSSANVFYKSGYRRISVRQQCRRWNHIDAIWLWIRTGLALDPGHFLWIADTVTPKSYPWRGRFFAVLFNTLLAVFAFSLGGGIFLSGGPAVPSVHAAVAFFVGVSGLLVAREIGVRLVAWFYKQPLEFRAWSGGWGISLLVAIGFGKTFPLPANLYPPGDGWHTRDFQVLLGQGAIVSNSLVAGLIMIGFLVRDPANHAFFAHVASALVFVGKPLLVFDTLVAVAPFEGFNGRHLRDYNRLVWLALSAIAVIIFIWA